MDDEFNIFDWFLKSIFGYMKEKQIQKSNQKNFDVSKLKSDSNLRRKSRDERKLKTCNENDTSDENSS